MIKIFPVVTIVVIVSLILIAFMSHAANKKTERQHYAVVKQADGYEIRFYPRAIMATVLSGGDVKNDNRNNNFRRLAGYIFGGNNSSQKIAMTAPVYMEADGENNKMSFVLPAKYQLPDLPKPNDSGVSLHYSDEGYFVALRFGGFAGQNKIIKKKNELKAIISKTGFKVLGEYKYLGYNAPWDIIGRENDIIVQIAYSK